MADRPLKLKDLSKKLRKYGVEEDSSIGKGSHTTFLKKFPEGIFTFPIPTHGSDVVKVCYGKGCRRKFRLRDEDGISDKDFYGK